VVATGDAVSIPVAADEPFTPDQIDRTIVALSAEVRARTAADDRRGAAMASASLGLLFEGALGNKVAARPWYRRATRLLEDEEPCLEQGWVALAPMGCDVDDPQALRAAADLALDLARRFGDVNLEIKALADGGLARVHAGQVTDGMAMLDEALALACGGTADNADAVGRSVCSFYAACYDTADFGRVASWSDLLRQRGVIGATPGTPAFLRSHCDSVRAALLCHLGRWGEAEQVLEQAHAEIEDAMPGAAWHTVIALAELRLLQGRLAEAEALLLGRDGHIQALVPFARLHVLRGDHDLAVQVARRGLRLLASDRVRAATLLTALVEAELGRGDVAAAAAASAELDRRTTGLALPAPAAEAARMRALVRCAAGDAVGAVEALHEGLDQLAGVDLPYLQMCLHAELAAVHEAAGDAAAARLEARAAAALLDRLDVVRPPGATSRLRRLGVAAPSEPDARCRVATLELDGAWWIAGCGELRARLRDTKGLRYLAMLVATPSVEHHVLDLVDRLEGVDVQGRVDRRRLGDAGAVLDGQARETYRHRVAELRDQVEDALAAHDDDRAARLQEELDALVAELARAFGLGGRERRSASAAERARLNVTRALRAALSRLEEVLPEAGAALDRRIRTGLFCAYEPDAADAVVWTVPS
jgi:hypothetical protein